MKGSGTGPNEIYPHNSAASHGLASCPACHLLSPVEAGLCPRCGDRLRLRNPHSIQITVALVLTAMLCYIPANLLPIMTTTVLGDTTESTIVGGVVLFVQQGSWFIAAVIFTASVIIPIAKMLIILWLCAATTSQRRLDHYELTKIYRVTEFIGKWSMIDVFVVTVLVALVQLSGLMSIQPGYAINAFGAVVILTMIAAHQFDVRLIWDKLEQ